MLCSSDIAHISGIVPAGWTVRPAKNQTQIMHCQDTQANIILYEFNFNNFTDTHRQQTSQICQLLLMAWSEFPPISKSHSQIIFIFVFKFVF